MIDENENEISPQNSITQHTGKDRNNLITQEEEMITIQKKHRKNLMYNGEFYEKKLLQNSSNNNENNSTSFQEINDTFDIDADFLAKEGCTSLTLGLEPMPQKCYICPICIIYVIIVIYIVMKNVEIWKEEIVQNRKKKIIF